MESQWDGTVTVSNSTKGSEGCTNEIQDDEVRLVGMGNCERSIGESDTRILMHLCNWTGATD